MDSYSYDPLTNSVVFNVAPIEGTEITIERVTTLERSISYETYNNSFRPETLNYDLDRIWHVLQEQNVIDAEILARIKDEIEWRRTHDKEFDLLAQAREGNLFNALKSYMDAIGAMSVPNLFDGITDNVVITEDGVSQRVTNRNLKQLIADLEQALNDIVENTASNVDAERARATIVEASLSTQITDETTRAISIEQGLQTQVNSLGVGNRAYKTYADMTADTANIPAKSKITVTNDSDTSKNGDYQFDGTIFTKSAYDILALSKQYTDTEIMEVSTQITNNNLSIEASIFGRYSNLNKDLIEGYISKTTGAVVINSGWRATPFLAISKTSILKRSASLIGSSSSAAAVGVYDSNYNFLGIYTDTAALFEIIIGEIYPTAAYVRLSLQSTITSSALINIYEPNLLINDFFKVGGVVNGYVTLTGTFVPSTTWLTTPLVPVKLGMEFLFNGYGSSTLVSNISTYDSNGIFLNNVFASTGVNSHSYKITDSNIKFVRASAALNYPYSFTGFELQRDTSKKYSVMTPKKIYALKNEPIFLYSSGIIGEDLDVAWNVSESNKIVCALNPTSNATIPIQLTTINQSGLRETLSEFDVVVTDTPVDPPNKRYFMCLGDSLTDGVALSNIQGAYVNELSRRLTGVGTQILPSEVSPIPLNFQNIEFIGTRGDQPVKHEGRGGWRATHYLNNASVNTISNAFWNPTTSKFDLDYYLNQNGFNDVASDGSNFTIIILLGWNDVYNSNATSSANDLSVLIDAIHSTHPQTDIVCLGLNPAPAMNFKAFTGNRFVSRQEVFTSICNFNKAYTAMIAAKPKVTFLDIAPLINTDLGYNYVSKRFSARSTATISGCFDHVHLNAVGYAMLSDPIYYYILYTYCQ
ncbi:SGNH/GDSL hydrolase family protein [Acinetobacter baumannii]|nr:SGNH/GDSL hydrolase family protein [Acinetobacter baumannii]